MKVGFIGLGKLGLPMALTFSLKGHDVIGYDLSAKRMTKEWFSEKELGPNKEDNFNELLKNSNLRFGSLEQVLEESELTFVVVQTPNKSGYGGEGRIPDKAANYDLVPIQNCFKSISDVVDANPKWGNKTILFVSTVLPGTTREYIEPVISDRINLFYNPALPAMGTVLYDIYNAEFIILGKRSDRDLGKIKKLYSTITDAKVFDSSIESAEMIKTCYNGFISFKIAYANTLMEMAHKIPGCDVDEVVDCLSQATRRLLSPMYMRGGMGDGGSCHPKDNIGLIWLAEKLDLSFNWFKHNMDAREKQTEWLASIIKEEKEKHPERGVLLCGIAFKAETNLIDGSPALLLKTILEEDKIAVEIWDPYLSKDTPDFHNKICVMSTKHEEFTEIVFPETSSVIDPWRYISQDCGASNVVSIGKEI